MLKINNLENNDNHRATTLALSFLVIWITIIGVCSLVKVLVENHINHPLTELHH